jgi:C1A family cysteine protease
MKLSSALGLLLMTTFLQAQEKGTGLIFDPPSLRTIAYKAKLTADSYKNLPSSVSLEKYCPTPGDQGQYSTCVAFATAYHLRTILYMQAISEASSATKGPAISPNSTIFSPSFVYEQIKKASDYNCQEGTNPVDAFDLLKTKGVAKLSTQPYACGANVKNEALQEGKDFRISDYQILFYPDETDADLRVNATKKALSEGYPCMLGFVVTQSFYRVKGDVWREQRTDDGPTGQHGRHAMCVVGYDDKKYGGSFRVMNSWGTGWADKGFVWIPYRDFAKYALLVIQAYGPPRPVNPKPDPKPVEPVIDVALKGAVRFQLNTGAAMNATRTLTRNLVVAEEGTAYKEDLVAYKMENAYSSGTRFRFFITTNTEAYVYAFATDLTGKVNKVLPFADNMSPRIGKNSTVAFPSETKVVKMDDNPGTDYLLILYSKQPLNAADMLAKMNAVQGGLSVKIKAALGDQLILPSDITYHSNAVGFDVKEKHRGTVAPLMVEITHN